MSRQQSAGMSSQRMTGAHGRRGYGRSVAMIVVLAAGVAACGGDDDDAADSTSGPATTGVEATAPDTTVPAEITAAHDTTGTDPSDTTTGATTGGTTPEGSEPETAGPEGTATDSTAEPEGAAAAAASEDATGTTGEGVSDGSAGDVGPTTTGPECEFEENSSLPLERCDFGPAVAVVQSILQADGYAVDIVDGYFGDQTLYALRAFQDAEGLTVDGIVGLETWTSLGVDEQFGADANGDGVIAPDELDLSE